MKRIISVILSLSLILSVIPFVMPTASADGDIIKVACVGDSITEGWASSNLSTCSYPAHLQNLLDSSKYEVKNFGIGGRTAMKNAGDYSSYWTQSNGFYENSLAYLPDIVIIMLGTNDVVANTWNNGETYGKDLADLVRTYQALETNPEIFLATPPTAFDTAHPTKIKEVAVPLAKQAAEETGATLIDINSMTADMEADFPDKIHPNDAGYFKLAVMFYENVFNEKAVPLTVKTQPGNVVSIGGLSKVADQNGEATLTSGRGTKSVKISKPGVGFAYVDIYVEGTTYADCSELTIVENLCLNGTAIATELQNGANYNSGFKPANGMDGDESTGWQIEDGSNYPYSYGIWLGCDFGSEKTFNSVEIVWEAGTRAAEGKYKIQYSDDKTNWTDASDTVYKYEAYDKVTFTEVTARYMRVLIEAGTNDKYRPKIYELRVFSASNDGFVPDVENNIGEEKTLDYDEDTMTVTGIELGTTVSELLAEFEGISVKDAQDTDLMATGMIVVDGEKEYTVIILGEVSGDGKINSTDFMQIRKNYLGLFEMTDAQKSAADVNGDGKINSTDFMQVRKHFLGLFDLFA